MRNTTRDGGVYLMTIELRADNGHTMVWACDPVQKTVFAPFSMLPDDLAKSGALTSGAALWNVDQEPYVTADFLLEQIAAVEPGEWARVGMNGEVARAKVEQMIEAVRAFVIK